ncbi:hypothetical protein N7527_007490 [Penicillium freii]|nr:hypothetical protein N7527_007490 [Penicillium freii]
MSSTVQGGYPVRRENSCGQFPGFKTWDNWYSCCPEGLSEPEQYGANSQCPDTNTGSGVVPAQCANSTWTLWWAKGYFCCEPQLTGFTNGRYWYGCATKTAINKNNTWTSATQTGTCSNKGLIAGATLGGFFGALIIVGIIWFMQRLLSRPRNNPEGASAAPKDSNAVFGSYTGFGSTDSKMGSKARSELPGPSAICNELQTNTGQRQELPGNLEPSSRHTRGGFIGA